MSPEVKRLGRGKGGRAPIAAHPHKICFGKGNAYKLKKVGKPHGANEKYGVVKWFNRQKGFGFIRVDGQPQEVFVHAYDVTDRNKYLEEGDRVAFVIVQGKKGVEARQVERSQ